MATKKTDDISAKKKELIKGFEDYINSQDEFCVDNVNVMEIMPYLFKLQNEKGLAYGRSFINYGDVSVFFNLARKWDRIDNIMRRALDEGIDKVLHSDESSTSTETFVDTVADLSLYSLMWVGYIRETHPDEWDKFVKLNNLG